MIDVFKIILWARSNNDDLDLQVQKVFDVLTVLSKVNYLNPKYLQVWRKKDAVEYNLTLENIKKLVIKNSDKQFPDLGSSVGFFTSLNDDEAVGIMVSVGNSNPRFFNSIVINIRSENDRIELSKYEEIVGVFKQLVNIFNPYFGCIMSSFNRKMYEGIFSNANNFPYTIYGVNYFNLDTIEKLKINKVVIDKLYEYEKIKDGYFIRLQKESIDTFNEEHIKFQQEVNKLLGI